MFFFSCFSFYFFISFSSFSNPFSIPYNLFLISFIINFENLFLNSFKLFLVFSISALLELLLQSSARLCSDFKSLKALVHSKIDSSFLQFTQVHFVINVYKYILIHQWCLRTFPLTYFCSF